MAVIMVEKDIITINYSRESESSSCDTSDNAFHDLQKLMLLCLAVTS